MGELIVTILTGLSSAASLFLVAAGLSIIFGVTRIVNFAHGSFYMLGAFIGYTMVQAIGGTIVSYWVAVLIAALVVGLIGVLMEILLLRRIYHAPELFQLIATFGVILVIQDVAKEIWGNEDIVSPRAPGLDGAVEIFGQRLPEYDLALIAIAPMVLIGLRLLFYKTRWGTLVRAATQDRQMVAALGVNQRWLFTGVVFLGSLLAGLGGAVQLPKGGADLLMDFGIIAEAFVVVVVGGMGSLGGAFLAAILIGLLNVFGIQIFPNSTLVMMFLVMAVVLVFRPWGLLGKPETPAATGTEIPNEPLRPAVPMVKVLAGLVLAFLIALPLLQELFPTVLDPFVIVQANEILFFVLFAAALHFIMGPGGMVSFGHAAFFGGGAYTSALLVFHFGLPFELAFPAAPIGAALLALIIGWFCVRLTGVYFAMLTLAFAQIAWSIVFQWTEVTEGDDGINSIWPSDWVTPLVLYYLTLGLTVAGVLLIRRIVFSPFGYALRAGRDSPLRSEAIGINIRRQQWFAFTISGAFAGVAGALFLYTKGSIAPTSMEIARSFDALLMTLLGGVEALAGPVVGAAAFKLLEDLFAASEYWRGLMGITIIALVLLLPKGVAGFAQTGVGRRLGLSRAEEVRA